MIRYKGTPWGYLMHPKWKYFVLCLVVVAVITLGVYNQLGFYSFKFYKIPEEIDQTAIEKYYSRFRLKSSSRQNSAVCKIPLTPAMPEHFLHHWNPSVQDCSFERKLATVHQDGTLQFFADTPVPCCIQEVIRGNDDSKSSLTSCKQVHDGENISKTEAFFLKCGDFINAEANILIKGNVEEKLSFWESSLPTTTKPFSIFLFGFDSVSRAHAYRSLPKSIHLMMDLGFVDFHAYHSAAPSTLTNFMAILMGLPRVEVRRLCAPNWTTPFDSCPLIWKEFSKRNYITSYIEDGSQTFNWGGQSGFVEQPTDYYLHHLFKELKYIREHNQGLFSFLKTQEIGCASTETIPEFILRYNSRFLKKFAKVPFFSLTWFADPFHDDLFALASFDTKLAMFFEMISKNKDILENTIIIFLSDHGDRTSFFSGESPESYIERGLPPLFIRLPERLKKKQPEMVRALERNAHQFTTPFDIHQTLLHILNLNEEDPIHKNSAHNGSSVFVDFPLNKTCSNSNIPIANCLCNLEYDQFKKSDKVLGTDFTKRMLMFSLKQLNSKIEHSKYKTNCSRWTARPSNVEFHRVIMQTDEFIDTVIAFKASPGEAVFEARLKVDKNVDGTLSDSIFLKGFARASRYGDQSWCVRGETDEDKYMKELCYCKNKK